MSKLRIIPLGGLGEIGRNCMVVESDRDLILVDAGLMFPEQEMLGVDLVIPNIEYVLARQQKLRAIVLTHGHEDHIGGLSYLLPRLPAVPVHGTKLTLGLVEVKLRENGLLDEADLQLMAPGDELTFGELRVRPFRVNHSIPDAVGLAIETPQGMVIHTGDFKFDHTPVDGKVADFQALARYGQEGVLLLLSDSTYAETPGYTPSEMVVSEALSRIMGEVEGRVIVTTFASLISRIQQVVDAAVRHGRKVGVVGRSMENNVQMALELGYLKAPPGTLQPVAELSRLPHHEVAIVTTGSQGEPSSALSRMANGDHRQITIIPGDTVIMSATAIPGNENAVHRTIDNLFRLGANVLYNRAMGVHVQGHASQEELKLMMNLVRPRHFVPIHGEPRHLAHHARLAREVGIVPENIFILEDGDVLELDESGAEVVDRVPADYVYVDGLSVGEIGQVVLRDRLHLSRDGIVVAIVAVDKQTGQLVGRPDIVTRGFVHNQEAEDLLERAKDMVVDRLNHGQSHYMEWSAIHSGVRDSLSRFLYQETRRRPMVIPVAMEV
jgi:ribonuclease J